MPPAWCSDPDPGTPAPTLSCSFRLVWVLPADTEGETLETWRAGLALAVLEMLRVVAGWRWDSTLSSPPPQPMSMPEVLPPQPHLWPCQAWGPWGAPFTPHRLFLPRRSSSPMGTTLIYSCREVSVPQPSQCALLTTLHCSATHSPTVYKGCRSPAGRGRTRMPTCLLSSIQAMPHPSAAMLCLPWPLADLQGLRIESHHMKKPHPSWVCPTQSCFLVRFHSRDCKPLSHAWATEVSNSVS